MEREEMPCDVVFVGAGPANLAGAIHLMNLIEAHNQAVAAGTTQGEVFDEPMIVLLEKGSEVGAHQLSGAVVDPRALDELLPDWRDNAPIERWVEREDLVFLTPSGQIPAPWIPPEMVNKGKPIFSLGQLCKWMAEIAEEKGVNIFPGFAGAELLWEGEAVNGVRTGDKGIGPDGKPKDTFEPGMDLTTAVTILGEGPRGHLTKQLIAKKALDAHSNPMVYEIGTKEILELPEGTITDGFIVHSIGYPLDTKTFGGSFLYSLGGDRVCIGMLTALDASNPNLDCHHELQRLKDHPYIRSIIGKGKVVKYGAKAVSMGGWSCMPQLYTDGAMIVGDSGSFLNPMRIKGIHLSMKSGMLAAETAFAAMLSGQAGAEQLQAYKQAVDASWIKTEMEGAKNFHAHFENGLVSGMVKAGADWLFGPGATKKMAADHTHMHTLADTPADTRPALEFDGSYLVDKLTDVYHSGTQHEEQQPAHLHVADLDLCVTTCKEEYGNPCTKFCPAQVYNMVTDEDSGQLRLQIDFSNCVHCKTCDIRDPYQIITWVPPEGGNGPEFHMM